MLTKLAKYANHVNNMQPAISRIKSFEDAQQLADSIAEKFAAPNLISMGILELLLNAIEHGNLNIGHDEKCRLHQQGIWHQEVNRRINLPENSAKYVEVELSHQEKYVSIKITDQGQGFNWQQYQQKNILGKNTHGRGILIAKSLAFTNLEYIGCGNQVIGKISL